MKALDGSAYEPMPAQLGRILGHRRSHGILAVLVALPLLGVGSAPAQEALSSDPAPTPAAAFPAAEILSRADESAAGLRRIRTLLKPSWWCWFEHQNLRDERAEVFASELDAGVYDYTYVARATTPGEFVVGPPRAEEMYHPETFGRGASARVHVR